MFLKVILLAAGKGSRMCSQTPKVLHFLAGKTLLSHVLDALNSLPVEQTFIVYNQEAVKQSVSDGGCIWVEQKRQLGTGHAVLTTLPYLVGTEENYPILVLYGDVPLVSEQTLKSLLQQKGDLILLSAKLSDPTGYGRILRDSRGRIVKIIEEKEANETEKLIEEVNSGIMVVRYGLLKKYLPLLPEHQVNQEYYLTDLVSQAVKEGFQVISYSVRETMEIEGINDLVQLSKMERWYQVRTAERLMRAGLQISDPKRFDLRGSIEFASEVKIDINVILEGKIILGKSSFVGNNCYLKNVELGERVTIHPNSILEEVKIEEDCVIGPFARVRPGSYLHRGSRVGNFVELKQCELGEKSKVNHLSYLGDAWIGQGVNVGAGTITCNFDGKKKMRTVIGSNSFIGSNSALVAPVTLGEEVVVGAGSVITREVPKGDLAIGRARQVNLKRRKD